VCKEWITQFYLPPTHEPYLPSSLPSRKASPPFGWYSLRLPMKGWPGWVDLGGWSHTEINVPHRELNPDSVAHLSTNRTRRWLTSLIEANALTPTPGRHHVSLSAVVYCLHCRQCSRTRTVQVIRIRLLAFHRQRRAVNWPSADRQVLTSPAARSLARSDCHI